MHNPDIVKIIAAIRDSHPDMEQLYMEGQCYAFHLILRSIFPYAQAWYSPSEGHVYSRIYGSYYDIRGLHLKPPADICVLNHKHGDKPHRWGKRDFRRLTVIRSSLDASPVGVKSPSREIPRRAILKGINRFAVLVGAGTLIYLLSTKEEQSVERKGPQ